MGFFDSFVEWLISWAASPFAPLALFAASFIDSVLIPIPPEPLLVAMAVAQPAFSIPYAVLATVASVLGATLDYFIGLKGGRPLAERFVKKESLRAASEFYRRHDVWTVGLAAFTPLPYPVFALAAGVARLKARRFILASLAGRSARFLSIGVAVYLFGEEIQRFLEQYLGLATAILGAVIIAAYVTQRILERRLEKRGRSEGE